MVESISIYVSEYGFHEINIDPTKNLSKDRRTKEYRMAREYEEALNKIIRIAFILDIDARDIVPH